ncbi:MAG: prephenate dehydrogenase [Candidatus Odinarchaeota archaeon]|nr:prephenate dehydrogenase [Candidatus Odinarchaeota archaeon]
MFKVNNVFVIGTGRMGLWFINYIKPKKWYVRAYDLDLAAAKSYAKSFGFEAVDTLTDVAISEIIFVATPIKVTLDVIKFIASFIKKKAWLVEIASLKKSVVPGLRILAEKYNLNILSIHPLFGPDINSIEEMNFALVPVLNKEREIEFFNFLFNGAKYYVVDEDTHDKAMAYNLSLIHLIGHLLYKLYSEADKDILDKLSTKSYFLQQEIVKRVHDEPLDMEISLLMSNEYGLEVFKKFHKLLSEIIESIEQKNKDRLIKNLYT